MTFAGFGGTSQGAIDKAWLQPYAALTGVTWVQSEDSDPAQVKLQVESGNVTWDVLDNGNEFGLESDGALLEPIDYSVVDRSSVPPDWAGTYRIANLTVAFGIGYNTDKTAGAVPASWADFFDLGKFPGKRVLRDYWPLGTLDVALAADGVSPESIYPLDMDRALGKLDTIKASTVFASSSSQAQELLGSGEAALALISNARVAALKADGAPVDFQWNHSIVAPDYWVVPKGAPNKAIAMEFIAWANCAENNGAVSKYANYGPANPVATTPPDKTEDLPSAHIDQNTLYFDDQYVHDNFNEIDAEFSAWLTK